MGKSISLDQVIDRLWREHTLFSAVLELTYHCNLDCEICYNDRKLRGQRLRTEQYLQLLADLAGMGVMNLTLTGGEPLAHPDFFQIGSVAKKLGFAVRIKTNGHGLQESVARRIQAEIDPYSLDISLHGATPGTHDRQTRAAGSFDRLMQNLEALKSLGLRFRLNTPVTRWNENEIEGMALIAEKYNVHINFDPDITPRDDGNNAPLLLAPTPAGIRRSIAWSEKLRAKSIELSRMSKPDQGETAPQTSDGYHPEARDLPEKHCGAGSSTITVDPFGTVYPCVQWRQAVGNLHEQSVNEIWENSVVLKEVREQNSHVKLMIDHEEGADRSRFCAGRAVQETGKPVQFYSLARLTMQLQQEGQTKKSAE